MAADPDDMLRATRAAAVAVLADASLKARFPTARDALPTPDAGFFVDVADALAALAAKEPLVSRSTGRFVVEVQGNGNESLEIDPSRAIPTLRLIDSELAVDMDVLVTRVELRLEDDSMVLEVIG